MAGQRKLLLDLGPDGLFVIDPDYFREDPLEPLKRDLARLFGFFFRQPRTTSSPL